MEPAVLLVGEEASFLSGLAASFGFKISEGFSNITLSLQAVARSTLSFFLDKALHQYVLLSLNF